MLSLDYPNKVSSSDSKDDIFKYSCSLLTQRLLFTNFLDATCEGDGERSIRCWKFFLLHSKEEKSTTKYSLEALYLLFQVYSLLPPAEAHSLVWNRTVNNKGEPGKNVALDLDLEHDNDDLKQPIKNFGPSVTEDALRRISHGQQRSKTMLGCLVEKSLSNRGQASMCQLITLKISEWLSIHLLWNWCSIKLQEDITSGLLTLPEIHCQG